jgi:hypothetical protein
VAVAHRPRTRGRSKFRLTRLVGHALELYVAFSRRAVHGAALLALGVAALTGLLAATGLLTAPLAVYTGLAAQVAGLVALAVLLRYTALLADAQARPAMFYIREASIPVSPADALYPLDDRKAVTA